MTAQGWKDFKVIMSGDGLKLEQWGAITLLRPDPQAVWKAKKEIYSFDCHAKYVRSASGGGRWETLKPTPDSWRVHWEDMCFAVQPTSFKHTGIFPEQAVNWRMISDIINARKSAPEILNLFAYTGASTAVFLKRGARVTHVDAAKGMVERAKNNMRINSAPHDAARFIVDDCMKFVLREQRRGKTYNGIVMDPPSYGRGPNGEVWKIEDSIYDLVCQCVRLLKDPAFFLINSYTTGLQPTVLKNILTLAMPKGNCTGYEVCLPTDEGIELPCGCSGLWTDV